MYPKYHQQTLRLVILTVFASVAFTACESDSGERAETLTSPAVFTRTAPGQTEANMPGEIRIMIGTTRIMTTNANNSRAKVLRWSSSNSDVASVTTSGVARGVSAGSAVLTVSGAGISEAYQVIVESALDPQVVATVQVASPTTSLTVGGTAQMAALASNVSGTIVNGRPVQWRVSEGTAVTVNATGLVTATATGSATIQATIDGISGYRSVTVASQGVPQTVASVLVNSPTTSIGINGSVQMSASPTDMFGAVVTGRAVVWRVYSGTAVTVSATGLVAAVSTGTAMVQATVDGVSGYRTITVGAAAAPFVTSFAVSPKTGSTLAAGATRQFTTSVQWSDHAPRAVTVTYSATGGTISSSGLFTAGQVAGTFMVFASCTCGEATIIDTAYLAVSAPSAQLSTLTISPKSVTLAPSTTQQFTVTASWSTGATTVPPVTYTADGGYVSSGGLFTAPTTAGTYRVIVAHTGGTKKDTATVVVQSGGAAPPPPPTGSWSILRDFNSGIIGTKAERTPDGFDDVAGASVYSNERSFDGGQSAKLSIVGGTEGWGNWGGSITFPSPLRSGSELWLQMYIYMPADFIIATPGNGSLKFIRVRTKTSTGGNGGFNDIQFRDDANQTSSFRMIKEGQDQWFSFGAPNGFSKNMWQRVTVNLKFSSVPTTAGGVARVRVWQNGQLLVDEGRMQTLSSSSDVADALYLFTYWNGKAPQTQSLWVDQIQMSNFRPGWASDLQ